MIIFNLKLVVKDCLDCIGGMVILMFFIWLIFYFKGFIGLKFFIVKILLENKISFDWEFLFFNYIVDWFF